MRRGTRDSKDRRQGDRGKVSDGGEACNGGKGVDIVEWWCQVSMYCMPSLQDNIFDGIPQLADTEKIEIISKSDSEVRYLLILQSPYQNGPSLASAWQNL